jgi:hypothetical protein
MKLLLEFQKSVLQVLFVGPLLVGVLIVLGMFMLFDWIFTDSEENGYRNSI